MRIRTHLAFLAGVTIAAAALVPAAADSGKIALCHATGSDTNPYVKIVVSTAAFYQSGHVAHAGDIFPAGSHKGQAWEAQGDQSILANGCVVPTQEPTPTPTPTPMPTVTPTTEPTPMPTVTPEPTTSPEPTETPLTPTQGPTHPGSVPTVPDTPIVPLSPAPTTPADPCALGDPLESRMCETSASPSASPSVPPVESSSASSTRTALPAEAPVEQVRPGLPRAGA